MSQSKPTDEQATIYAESYVLQGEQTKAFKAAFPDTAAKPDSLYAKSSKFHALVKVQVRIKEIQRLSSDRLDEEFTVSIADKKKILATVAKLGIKESKNLSAAVSAVSELNRMDGDHAPAKQDHTSSDGSMTPVATITRTVVGAKPGES